MLIGILIAHDKFIFLITDRTAMESVDQDTIRTLLQNSRATSRAASRTNEQCAITSASDSHLQGRPDSVEYDSRPRTSDSDAVSVSSRLESRYYGHQPFLPQIDPKGSLTTSSSSLSSVQKLNNLRLTIGNNSSAARGSAVTVRNQFADSYDNHTDVMALCDMETDQSQQFPRPPSGRRSQDSRNCPRTKSPYTHSSLETKD